MASSSKTGSRSKNQFSPSYIEQRTEDDIPDRVKGAAVWKSYPDTEGYYVWNNVLNKYVPLEYDKTTKVWATLAQDEQGRWYTVQPAPLEYSLGPYQENPTRIIMDSDTEESAQDYNQTPVAPVDATQGDPSVAPHVTSGQLV